VELSNHLQIPSPQVMDEFEVSTATRFGCHVVTVRGDLDGDTTHLLDDALDRLSPPEPVIVDLTRLVLLTSVGVQSLLREREWGRPALACPEGRIASILEIVQAQRVVPIYRNLEAALVSLGDDGLRQQHS
jgi:anti-anti-sigma factor